MSAAKSLILALVVLIFICSALTLLMTDDPSFKTVTGGISAIVIAFWAMWELVQDYRRKLDVLDLKRSDMLDPQPVRLEYEGMKCSRQQYDIYWVAGFVLFIAVVFLVPMYFK